MGIAIKAILGLVVLGCAVLVIYGYSADMAPPPKATKIDVVLDAD